MEIIFHKNIDEEQIREEVRECIEDNMGIEILEIN